MKKTIYILALSLLLGSCGGILDVAPDGRTSFDDIFKDHNQTGAYLNSCYDFFQNHGAQYAWWARVPAMISDEAWDADDISGAGNPAARYYNGNMTANDHPLLHGVNRGSFDGDYWNHYWMGIRKCTFFLTKIEDANVNDEGVRRRWTAEAQILRAYYYMELLKWFGCGLPIIKDEVYDWTTDVSVMERKTYQEVAQFIMDECEEALRCPELPWRINAPGEMGRVTKAMAEAIRSRTALYAASPLYNEGADLWDMAYQVTKRAVENLADPDQGAYGLYRALRNYQEFTDPNAHFPNEQAAIYAEYFIYNPDYTATPVDPETIYAKKHSDGAWFGNLWDVEGIGMYNASGKTGPCPTQELVDAYETTDGQPVLMLDKPYLDDKHLQPNYNPASIYDPDNPYENRDPRFYATVYYNGSKRYCFWYFDEPPQTLDYPATAGYRSRTIATYVGEPYTGISETSNKLTRTGYFTRKFLHPTCCDQGPIVQAAAFKIFRYGELLLNFAEAAVEAGGGARLMEAWNAVNEIRDRVGMPPLPVSLQNDQQGLLLRIRNERRVELAMEEHRYFDVRRWSSPTGDLAATDRWLTAIEITRNGDGSYTYKRRNVRTAERACYTNRYLKLPIPLREVNIILEATGENWQNPGW